MLKNDFSTSLAPDLVGSSYGIGGGMSVVSGGKVSVSNAPTGTPEHTGHIVNSIRRFDLLNSSVEVDLLDLGSQSTPRQVGVDIQGPDNAMFDHNNLAIYFEGGELYGQIHGIGTGQYPPCGVVLIDAGTPLRLRIRSVGNNVSFEYRVGSQWNFMCSVDAGIAFTENVNIGLRSSCYSDQANACPAGSAQYDNLNLP
jgi:hypothetical protein